MRFFAILLILTPFLINAQPCANNPGMSPSTAIPVCGTSTFIQNVVANCTGAQNIPNSTACGTQPVTSGDSFWYRFHCFQTGTLGFLITPMSNSDDYDWEVFDLTGNVPNNVYSNQNMRVSINLSGQSGPTGCTSAGIGNVHCAGGANGTQYNSMPIINAGADYLLMVTNYSQSGLGYRLNFTGGTAVITDPNPPLVDHVETGCSNTAVQVFFSKDIRCSSVTSSGSEFTIMPGNIPVASISSNCALGFNAITQLTVNSSVALSPGPYTLVINNGTDGNTFKDACDNAMLQGTQIPFTISVQPPGLINNVSFSGCAPSVITIQLSNPVRCNSITAAGTELAIVPGNPVITAVQSPDCSSGATFTKTLQVYLQNPLPYNNYQLLLNNGSDGNTYIDTCGTAMLPASVPFNISQTPVPVISLVDYNQCQPNQVTINFDKVISCSSLTASASEFTVNPGNIPITSVLYTCAPGGYASQVTLVFANPLVPGGHTVSINNGSDGNTLSDTCFSFIPAGYSVTFNSNLPPLPVFDSVQSDKCNPSFVKVFYSHPIQCSTVSADGTDFTVTGPTAVNIVSATTDITCVSGYTNWVLLNFAQPVNTAGNFVIHNLTGSDGNGIIDTCSATQNPAETISFTAFVKPSSAFTQTIKWGCVNDTINFSHPGGNGINSWQWKFSDNTTATGQQVSHIFPANAVSVTAQLIVGNGQCPDTSLVTIPLDNAFNVTFVANPADTVCIGKDVSFTNNSTGNNLSYTWEFGDNTSFTGATPPLHVYAAPNNYNVRLIAANNHGCIDTARKNITVSSLPAVDFTGLNSRYCGGDIVTLNAVLQGNFSSYSWDNGDGKTILNKPRVNFSYINEGSYDIKLSADDRYCGSLEKIRSTFIYKTPVIELGNDTALCPNTSISIGINAAGTYPLLWNTGETTPRITTQLLTKLYKLSADNNGCRGVDSILITMRLNCLIKVPNAFTPNNDGRNDLLKAINADFDLTKQFSFSVFNRLGQKVFSSNNPTSGWDGKFKGMPQDSGAYVWELKYTDRQTGKEVYEKGSSLLIR